MIPAMATPSMALLVVALVVLDSQRRGFPSERQDLTESTGAPRRHHGQNWTPPYGRAKYLGLSLFRGLWKVRR